jgi:hypothetical protein
MKAKDEETKKLKMEREMKAKDEEKKKLKMEREIRKQTIGIVTKKEVLHQIIRTNILNGNLITMDQRQYLALNFKDFIPANEQKSIALLNREFIKGYRNCILDPRIEFQVKADNNIGIFATEDIECIGSDVFVGSFTRQLSKDAAQKHQSCVQRGYFQSQYWVLVGSIALLNHSCNCCSKIVPYNVYANNESAHYDSSYRMISQIGPILNGEEICYSYSDCEDDISFECSICN